MMAKGWTGWSMFALAMVLVCAGLVLWLTLGFEKQDHAHPPLQVNRLPEPAKSAGMSLAEALARRRSHREFSGQPLTQDQIAALCWAAQGISDLVQGFRTTPSAGALYPLTVFIIDPDGLHEYEPKGHVLKKLQAGDLRRPLQAAALDQPAVGAAPVCMVLTMDVSRLASRYGARAERYSLLEVGHAAQNVLLQATALGLVGVPIAALDESQAAKVLHLPSRLQVVYLIPLGHPAK